jgi:hypothetical protein
MLNQTKTKDDELTQSKTPSDPASYITSVYYKNNYRHRYLLKIGMDRTITKLTH